MKQKERLAKEFSENIPESWNARSESYKAYLAGFEKAKELMLKRTHISVFEEYQTKYLGEKDEV